MELDCEVSGSDENIQSKGIIDCFKEYADELDAEHDLYEKLVRKSRDVTQESKKIIFLLHRVENRDKSTAILKKAEKRLRDVYILITEDIGSLLASKDVAKFARAFTSGMQEFVEAVSLYYYLEFGKLLTIDELHEGTFLQIDKRSGECEIKEEIIGLPMSSLLTPMDYILGICDLTGELMRRCISSKDLQEPFVLRTILVEVYNTFRFYRVTRFRNIKRKFYVLKASMRKVERACYLIQSRLCEAKNVSSSDSIPANFGIQKAIFEMAFVSEQDVESD